MDQPIANTQSRLKEMMEVFGITQTELCRKADVAESAMSNYLKGIREPKQAALAKISKAWNVSPTWLMGFDVPMQPESQSDLNIRLTAEESALIEIFRKSGDTTKSMIRRLLAYSEATKK